MSELQQPAYDQATTEIKRRIPKACASCRQSKVKCDGQRPCSRCAKLHKSCIFAERPKEEYEQRIDALENEVKNLEQQLQHAKAEIQSHVATQEMMVSPRSVLHMQPLYQNEVDGFQHQTHISHDIQSTTSKGSGNTIGTGVLKRKRSQLEVQRAIVPDFILQGILTYEQAREYFGAFFRGCDRYVPIFDPRYDEFENVRQRSGLLFNAICTVGCGVCDGNSQLCRSLNSHLQKWLNFVTISTPDNTLETVQALLVTACYVSERSLILALATRRALDMSLPNAYDELVTNTVLRSDEAADPDNYTTTLMRKARTWFGLLVLEHILRIDAGNLPGFSLKGGVRRCRILLNQHFSTKLDMRLLSQVELNTLRAKIHNLIDQSNLQEDTMDLICDAKTDLDIWYNDWKRIIETSPLSNSETPSLLLNLKVQRYWAESVALCRAIKSTGIDNIAAMSSDQQDILVMAKRALKTHLEIILSDPPNYLANFKYAMDFVWAKCAFCFLLLLKLTRLFPDQDDRNSWKLLSDGNQLYQELVKVGGSVGPRRNNAARMYLQVLKLTIEKFSRALQGNTESELEIPFQTRPEVNSSREGSSDLEAFIPEEFVFEWDFPGLTLFSSSTSLDEFFDEYLLSANSRDDWLMGMGF